MLKKPLLYQFLPYPPIIQHGVIGDRRTAALVAADGTINWHCLPDYDGEPVFGTLLDAEKGGFWRFGPQHPELGEQRYLEGTALLLTKWESPSGELELTDVMISPEDDRAQEPGRRTILRRLRCLSGTAAASFVLAPRVGFKAAPVAVTRDGGYFSIETAGRAFGLWSSFPLEVADGSLTATVDLAAGEAAWAVFGVNLAPITGGTAQLEAMLEETIDYWRKWSQGLKVSAGERAQVERSAITVHLLTYAPAGSAVAAVTTSLPERIGGDWNADYRFAWVRDTSLSLALLALLGKSHEVGRYLDWLSHRDSVSDAPLQVLYHADGRCEVEPTERWDLEGYRGSRPVRFGNHAFRQRQHGAVGYFADCALIYLEHGGEWRAEYWDLIRRVADYSAKMWREPDNGIWELSEQVHWVSSKVMSWVVLDRSIRIADKVGRSAEAEGWRPVREEIRREVLSQGWSERTQSFRQHYSSDEIDADLLLIPVMEFLPATDPRVAATVARIEQELVIDGFVCRFLPRSTPGISTDLPVGAYEGAFFPTTFWLATTYIKAGQLDKAEAILDRCERLAGLKGIFPEGIDPTSGDFRGNTPLLFSQVEYARARLLLSRYRAQRHDMGDTSGV